jgi:hypothetical protein
MIVVRFSHKGEERKESASKRLIEASMFELLFAEDEVNVSERVLNLARQLLSHAGKRD